MHGMKETTQIPRLICTLLHALFLALAAWLYFGGSYGMREIILFSFGVVLFLRIGYGMFFVLKRKFSWEELGGVGFALFVYQVGFALLAGPAPDQLDALDIVAIVLFVGGSLLHTIAELQRKRFKGRPENQGVLYTQGLFRYARHINYFGDIVWVTGWALMTRNIWSALIPLMLIAAFIGVFIPSLSRHLHSRYGEQYETWARTTKKLIPFVY